MFILWGWGFKTRKIFTQEQSICPICKQQCVVTYVRQTTWFTLFFIPIIPYGRNYFLNCGICGSNRAVDKAYFLQETARIAQGLPSSSLQGISINTQPFNEYSPAQNEGLTVKNNENFKMKESSLDDDPYKIRF